MALRVRLLSPPLPLLVLLLPVSVAQASTECMTIDELNAWMTSHEATSSLILRYDATRVNRGGWPNTKGCLADLAHKACTTGASVALKVYGPDDPPNEAHPTGTLKQEYGDSCSESGDCGETWADPNASDVVFTDGSEVCTVTVWTDPDTFGYELDCTSGSFVGVGTNDYDMPVDYIALFPLSDGSTWKMESAVSTWNEVCFEAPDEGADEGGGDGTDGAGVMGAASSSTPSRM